MVAVQLGVPVDEALLRMRAHAFSTEETVVETAEAVIERRLRFDPRRLDHPSDSQEIATRAHRRSTIGGVHRETSLPLA